MRRRPHVPEILLLPLLTLTLRMGLFFYYMESVQFNSVAQFCPTLCNPMDCSTPDFLVYHQLLEFAQTHVHWPMMASNHLILCRPFFSYLQSFPASGSFPRAQLFASGGQRMDSHGILSTQVLWVSELLRTPPTMLSAWGCAVYLLGSWGEKGEDPLKWINVEDSKD